MYKFACTYDCCDSGCSVFGHTSTMKTIQRKYFFLDVRYVHGPKDVVHIKEIAILQLFGKVPYHQTIRSSREDHAEIGAAGSQRHGMSVKDGKISYSAMYKNFDGFFKPYCKSLFTNVFCVFVDGAAQEKIVKNMLYDKHYIYVVNIKTLNPNTSYLPDCRIRDRHEICYDKKHRVCAMNNVNRMHSWTCMALDKNPYLFNDLCIS